MPCVDSMSLLPEPAQCSRGWRAPHHHSTTPASATSLPRDGGQGMVLGEGCTELQHGGQRPFLVQHRAGVEKEGGQGPPFVLLPQGPRVMRAGLPLSFRDWPAVLLP